MDRARSPRRRGTHRHGGVRWTAAVLGLSFVLALAWRADAQEPQAPLVFSADSLTYDRDSEVVVAEGRVEVAQEERVLRADRVRYDARTGLVRAEGNVSILEPTGEVVFADEVELKDDLREGFVIGIGLLMTDDSRLAANGARRTADQRTVMSKAVFSACKLCPEEPERAPLWQIKAVSVTHDQAANRIEYRDAVLELGGIPIAYTPFFSHPDPSVERKTGFLAPTYGSSGPLGLKFEAPFYVAFAPHRDATLTPLVTGKEGVALSGEYRERTRGGHFELRGSITETDKRDENNAEIPGREIRGHLDATGRFDLDNTWRTGFDIARATDDTYLRRYDISSQDTLTTNLFAEGFRGRTYASANAYFFQGLRAEDDPGATPIVAPLLDYNFISQPGSMGGRYALDANLMVLERTEGTDSRRLSLSGGWHLPYTGRAGELYALGVGLRGDAYWTSEARDPNDPTRPSKSGFAGRLIPEISLGWRLPLARTVGATRQVIEPIAMVVLSPNGSNPSKIPNEDSQSFELDDTNLFETNRFAGLDRVEAGPRASYGVRFSVYGLRDGYASALIGQSLRLKKDSSLGQDTGLEDEFSDVVGRISIVPSRFLDITNRFRLDGDTFSVKRNEVKLSAGPDRLRFDLGYVSLDRLSVGDQLTTREEINARARFQFARFWSTSANARRDLQGNNGGMIEAGFGVSYEDECFLFETGLRRDFTSDRDVRPSTSFVVRVRFKHIG